MRGLQLVGALYLGWLGLSRLRSPASQGRRPAATRPSVSGGRHLLQGLLVSLIHPKLIIFFLALFPPFIQADRPVLPQLVLRVASFCLLSFIIHCSYAGAATALSARLTSGITLARMHRAAGALFLMFTALLGRLWAPLAPSSDQGPAGVVGRFPRL